MAGEAREVVVGVVVYVAVPGVTTLGAVACVGAAMEREAALCTLSGVDIADTASPSPVLVFFMSPGRCMPPSSSDESLRLSRASLRWRPDGGYYVSCAKEGNNSLPAGVSAKATWAL